MSGRFVSGGTIDSAGEVLKEGSQETLKQTGEDKKSKEWELVQQELDAERRRREEHRAKTASGGEKSLYDILQENKAAKQAAFEEQTKVRNQFRALDDDEVGFLDEVREKQRQEDERVRRETEERLKAFRERQKTGPGPETDDRAATAAADETEAWGVGKKRKRAKDKDLKGVRRRVSEGNAGQEPEDRSKASRRGESTEKPKENETDPKAVTAAAQQPNTAKKASALVGYGSDSSDDE